MKKTSTDRRLDRTNLRILDKLSRGGRMSYSELADNLGCSINTVRDRIFAMERRGVIRGYEARVDETQLGRPVHAMILLEPDEGMRRPNDLKEELKGAGILRANLGTGKHSLVIEMVSTDIGSLHETVREQIYPLGFRNAHVILLGPSATSMVSETEVEAEAQKIEVTA